jgi:protein-S-isoprenylcysteine O-methyltransferase Ste14
LFLGLFFSFIFPIKVFDNLILNFSGFLFLFLFSYLILWAQLSSRKFKKENVTKESFMQGPYRFTRNPTTLGLFFSLISFGIIINSIFVILFSLISFLISVLFFFKKEEQLLEKKYGQAYLEYKNKVKF